jgi:hypothetical protein
MGSGEGVKPRLFQALTRGARPDSNSRPAVQISNHLPSRYVPWGQYMSLHVHVLSMIINMSVQIRLRVLRLILRILKLTTM